MLTLLLGTDWICNRNRIMQLIADDVSHARGNRILMVPELISHDTERRLADAGGDTTSRFAEVLSFTRLYRRVSEAAGGGVQECLDNGGRVTAMAAAARQLHSKLKTYAAVETKPEFLVGLVEAVDEFKRCCVTAEDLATAAEKTEGILAQKLEELSLLLQAYDALCAQGKRDPLDQMTWLLEQLEISDFAENHVFYIDGFPDFSRQHMAILEHLICNSGSVVISLACDEIASKNPAFEKAGATASEIYQFAKRMGVNVDVVKIPSRQDALSLVRSRLFSGQTSVQPDLNEILKVQRFSSVYDECLSIAEQVIALVQAGARYRDIGIVCSDMTVYRNTLNMICERCGIPAYLSGNDDILQKPVIITVLAAVEAALGGFERQDVIRYMKSILSPVDLDDCDIVENYVITWNISGYRWLTEWTNHPNGLGEEWTERDLKLLAKLNAARRQIVEPLQNLRLGFQNAVSIEHQVQALNNFFKEIRLLDRLENLSIHLTEGGDFRNAQIMSQIWEILADALQQLSDILGKTAWDQDTFTRLLRLLLSQYDVGTIPPVLDSVIIGPVSAMRCQEVKHLFVLGILEGSLPGYGVSAGVLTDQERTALRKLGVPLSSGGIESIQSEFGQIYGVFCGATEGICVSCPSGQPSFIYKRLQAMKGYELLPEVELGAALTNPLEAGALLVRLNEREAAEKMEIMDFYETVEKCVRHSLGSVQKENVRNLYGENLNLSASQIDRQADCRLKYFLQYGLRARERKTASVDPAEFGTYVHAILEKTGEAVKARGGFHSISLDEILKIASDYSQQYILEHFQQIDSPRLQHTFRRNEQELNMVVRELWEELQESTFEPIAFELGFGDGEEMPAIPIRGSNTSAQLRGFVDRVDTWAFHGHNYYRVVDYKTGRKDFDYCDLFNGYGLQMLLYMFALEDAGENVVGAEALSAGVQYFPARVPILASDGFLSDDEACAAREKEWKRKGLLLMDENVLHAMESKEKPVRLSCKRNRDGTLTGDLADRSQMNLLKGYIALLLRKMVDDIASGCVEPNPYTRGSKHNACQYCPYGSVCHSQQVTGRRDYAAMTAQRFWEEVEKAVKENG